mmetsp:Transcript_40218/g.97085  ORF Transcript_40218/g.97085 Transcript_40218/m.97085 type:complete len:476 (-) Transcript_40218:75-1502(-)
MAAAEAKGLLDQLMGADRNAPLPPGTALPRKRGQAASGDALLLPGKRHKSCYDHDICPLYCAWGVDVYDLFVNTKSDIGPNPNTADDAARKEFQGLPQHEKERMGYEHFLFNKLGELVQQCDRTVSRNNEKLNKELHRQLQKRGGQDYVIDVDEGAVEQLCRNEIMVEELTNQVETALKVLADVKQKEEDLSKQLEAKLKVKREADDAEESTPVKQEDNEGESSTKIKEEEKESEDKLEGEKENSLPGPSQESIELGKVTMEKQKILCDIANMLSQLGPLQEGIQQQEKNLNHVKSDITTDKTVCEVSGNFMSARDADERIAAHYAGKQYVGWKLVRDKFGEMLQKYGRYGPPPPMRGGGGPPPHMGPPRGGGGGGGFGGDRRGGGGGYGGDRGGGGGYGRDRDRGGYGHRGPPRQGGGPSGPGRWERNGGGGGGYGDRGGNRGGGGGGGYGRDRDRGGYGHRGPPRQGGGYGRR